MQQNIQINLNKILKDTPFYGKDIVVGVALSGGRDSVALAHAIKESGVRMIAVNVEHGIRGESSLNDTQFVKDLCAEWGIECVSYSVNVPKFAKENGYTIEQAARTLRYQCFDDAINNKKCDVIALAHHLDDQAETILMRIIRGTGISGICGMREVRGHFIRPLLEYSRDDIDLYVAMNRLKFVDDESNGDNAYSRNYLREEIARLKKKFPSICENISRLALNAQESNDFINARVKDVENIEGEVRIDISDLKDPTIAKRLIEKATKALNIYQDIEQKHYNIVLDLAKNESGKYVHLTHNARVYKEDKQLVFTLKEANKSNNVSTVTGGERQFFIGESESFNIKIQRIDRVQFDKEMANGKREKTLYIDIDKLPNGSVIRYRKAGDSISKFGGGSKSVGDFMTDKKIPLRKRDEIPLIANCNEVFAIFGVEISRLVKIDDATKNIAKLTQLRSNGY